MLPLLSFYLGKFLQKEILLKGLFQKKKNIKSTNWRLLKIYQTAK